MARAEVALSVGGAVFAVRSFRRRAFAVRSVGGVVFAVRSFRRRVFCGSVRWGRFHSKDEIEHQAVLARNTERTVLMVLK
jgi:hypothetical protein